MMLSCITYSKLKLENKTKQILTEIITSFFNGNYYRNNCENSVGGKLRAAKLGCDINL